MVNLRTEVIDDGVSFIHDTLESITSVGLSILIKYALCLWNTAQFLTLYDLLAKVCDINFQQLGLCDWNEKTNLISGVHFLKKLCIFVIKRACVSQYQM